MTSAVRCELCPTVDGVRPLATVHVSIGFASFIVGVRVGETFGEAVRELLRMAKSDPGGQLAIRSLV